MLTGALIGLGLSLLILLPGIHPTQLLLVLVPWFQHSPLTVLSAACVLVGASQMIGILQGCYQPVAKSLLAYADAATQMAYQGYGRHAVKLHLSASWTGYSLVLVLGFLLLIPEIDGNRALFSVAQLIRPLVPWVLGTVLLLTILRAQHKLGTLLITLGAIALGHTVFRTLPQSDWSMTALLTGLFMAPGITALLGQPKALDLPEDQDNFYIPSPATDVKGSLLGILTGFLAGLGSTSLVALFRDKILDDEDVLVMGSAAEAGNACFAIAAFLLMGSTRSGTAVAMSQATSTPDPMLVFLGLVLMGVGMLAGSWFVQRTELHFRHGMQKLPQKPLALCLFSGSIGLVAWHLGTIGLWVILAGWWLSRAAKRWQVPNQALLSALIGPVLIHDLGLAAGIGV